ncbi:lysine/arginine/ornithine ABC transporter substrate-binding protein [Arenibaculum pallidiluteum]|uniref:lysine/arginine/ornithine ABC transporter substrate-binding protein n=1 Tax=Arenibaculum pallidiluteum TaxID=2812559 RepID=UPI001A97529C|nr:lysine/arginine/ornithine ABC transporter substrate-binding protein [Arenibaculum pallidiluteum]
MKKSLTVLAAAAALAMTASVAQAQGSKIRVATEGAYPPWNATNAAGKLEGFEIDLANELCKRLSAQCEIVAQDWDGIIPSLQAKKYDVIMAGMSVTDERKKVIDFAGPYASEPTSFAALKNSPLLKGSFAERVTLDQVDGDEQKSIDALKAALKGKTVGVQVSTIQANMLEKHFPDVSMKTYDKIDSAGLDLVAGRIDAVLADRSAAAALAQAEGGKDITLFGPGFTGGVLGVGVGAGVRKDDAQLKANLDKAIQAATADGTIGKLSTQWFGFDISIKK